MPVHVHVHSPGCKQAGCWPTLSRFSFFIHSPWATTRLFHSIFLFSSSSPPPSIYLVIIVTWIVSDREEHSFENKTPALKARERKRNFILVPAARASDEFSSPCVSLFTVWVSLVQKNIIVWGGQSTEDAVCWEKTVTQFFSSSNEDLWHKGSGNSTALLN